MHEAASSFDDLRCTTRGKAGFAFLASLRNKCGVRCDPPPFTVEALLCAASSGRSAQESTQCSDVEHRTDLHWRSPKPPVIGTAHEELQWMSQ